jgi:hypothetical protein
MTTFSVLVTNSRNGGQHEILVRADDADGVLPWLAANRPHYIAKRIDALPNRR